MKNLQTFCCLIVFIIFGAASAQDTDSTPEMITDRPDATESPTTVPKKSIQVETGAFYESFEENNIKSEVYTYNTTLLRYGLLDNFELRLGFNLEDVKLSTNGNEFSDPDSSLSPLLAGIKVAIAEEDGFLPEIGLLGHLYLPFTVNKEMRPETTGVDFRFSFAHTLSERSSLAYNLGAQWLDGTPGAAYVYTLVYGYSITDRLGAYAEVYGDLPENTKANHFWDAGVTYALQPNIQLDATIGRSITEGQDILISAGISFRIPK
ncbi:transporter [Cochleicola gelatinilyticus]|uniref:Transporter n=1 Tax=Cochleicola gelatinilyticus TaxID=1763537 RepID=A0A167IYP2_9FLAO|nr:transporter [Cochleicola gelatinilyticus]OAB80141.1 hypothetical protein ULVI_05225 [Cochleicola gelatinilyticus]